MQPRIHFLFLRHSHKKKIQNYKHKLGFQSILSFYLKATLLILETRGAILQNLVNDGTLQQLLGQDYR